MLWTFVIFSSRISILFCMGLYQFQQKKFLLISRYKKKYSTIRIIIQLNSVCLREILINSNFTSFIRNLTKFCLLKVMVSPTDEFYHLNNRIGWNELLEQKNISRDFKLQKSIILFYILNRYVHGFLESICYLIWFSKKKYPQICPLDNNKQ